MTPRSPRSQSVSPYLRILGVIKKVKELFGNLTEKISQEYAKERERSKSPLCRCKDCGKEISKRAESCPGCGASPRRKKQRSGCGGCLVLCFLGFIFFAFIFGRMLQPFDRKTVPSPAPPANNNTVALPENPVISDSPSVQINPNHFTGKWYEGGTLHGASIARWNNASYSDKLATCADMAISRSWIMKKVQQSGDMDTLKPYANELMTCINTASDDPKPEYEHMKISEIAAMCIILSIH
ncbi:MAG: hypothetical protein D3903_08060 [Candidatus Electrothrix sp. GM3_4]|nr:hypothetical protein [Candidatus Electrothrix sp. GM3_4]